MRYLRYGLVAVFLVALGSGAAWAWPDSGNCVGCHSDFGGFGAATHDLHNTFINGCTYCHTSVGDTPATNSSGSDPNNSCSGCHSSGALRLIHVAATTQSCGCHNGESAGTEADIPPYYGTAATSYGESRSCWDNLDNDGDGDYDKGDADCIGVPNEWRSWSVIKQHYGD